MQVETLTASLQQQSTKLRDAQEQLRKGKTGPTDSWFGERADAHGRSMRDGQRLRMLHEQQDKIDAQQTKIREQAEEIERLRTSARTVSERLHEHVETIAKLERQLRRAPHAGGKEYKQRGNRRAHTCASSWWNQQYDPFGILGELTGCSSIWGTR